MCGIVGFAGRRQAAPILLDGLARLEYRGYDSAGVCVYTDQGLKISKTKGRLALLDEMTDGGKTLRGCLGIGHTRWATHGAPSYENAHPLMSADGKICIIHNGIIENYLALKDFLHSEGKCSVSETDTEVAANLIEYFYEHEGGTLLDALRLAAERFEGSYSIAAMCADDPHTIVAVKKNSPLIFGLGQGENFIASDVPAILKYTREVVYLNDGDMLEMTADSVRFFNALGEQVDKTPEHISWELSAAEKGGYPHFMIKEILEQPKVFRDTVSPRLRDGRVVLDDVRLSTEYLRGVRRIYIVACGTSYYVGCMAKYILEKTCRIPVEPILASEFRYSEPVLGDDTLVIVISQSGETADTLAALREANTLGARTLGIVNVVGSSIAKAAQDVLFTWAGPEIAVASTKAYTSQLAMIYLIAMYIGDTLGTLRPSEYEAMREALVRLPEQMERLVSVDYLTQIEQLAERSCGHRDVFFIGRNLDSASCLEGSLKLKEISYVHAESYPAGELKHGPISLIEDNTLVIALASVHELFDKMMANVKEVKARGARVLGLTSEDMEQEIRKTVDECLTVPQTYPLFQPSLNIVPLQCFAYYMALARGCDVDKPRNLAKSVTVE